jgi:phage terminase large subunit-like protein
MPWQQHVADVANEIDPETGGLYYTETVLSVPRQSGKTTIVVLKDVHRSTFVARRLGPQRITYTAQDRQHARRKLERDFAPALRASRSFKEIPTISRMRPTKPTEWKLSLNNGQEHILFGSGSYWQIDTPSAEAGHGETLDQGDIDEAFSHRTNDVEQAMAPAQITRRDAQLWVLSTVGDETSPYLYSKMMAGRDAVQSGRESRVAYFEWSLPGGPSEPGVDGPAIDDEDAWWEYLPALGHTITVEALRARLEAARRDPTQGEDYWWRAYGNQWRRLPPIEGGAVHWSPEVWAAVQTSDRQPAKPLVLGVECSPDRSSAAIALYGAGVVKLLDPVSVADLLPRVVEYAQVLRAPVALQKSAHAGYLAADLEAAGVSVVDVGPAEMGRACGALDVAVRQRQILVVADPLLGASVAAARTKQQGDVWVWDRKQSAGSIAPLVAVTCAAWAGRQSARKSTFVY